MNATWREMISAEMATHGESWSDIIHTTMDDAEADREFDAGYGHPNGVPFTVWTATRVYFPSEYDGAEGCASVPRNPCDIATEHI